MSNRRTSSDRPRGWSQESSSSQEEVILYRGNRIVNAPERQPTIPPSESRAQQDEGFARFLKKHSSPTHQRVTAGGRIVPMEQRTRPPVFSLPQANQGPEADRKSNAGDEINGVTKPSATQSQAKEVVTDKNAHQLLPQSHAYVSGNVGIADACETTTATNANIIAPNNVFAYDGVHHQPNYLQAVTSAPYYAAVLGDAYLVQNPPMYAGGAMPLGGFNNPVGLAFPIPYVPNAQMLGLPPSCGITTTPTEPQLPENVYGQHMLAESTANFEQLDRQLKAIDRHRAMTDSDPSLRDHRIAIVQLRAEAKTMMTYWAKQLGLDSKALPEKATCPSSSTLNVKAATYVPLRTHPSPETLAASTGNGLVPKGMQFEIERPKFDVRSARRPIPIVPPPEELPSPKKDAEEKFESKTESIEVDEWGLRLGPPPPEIQRQQSQMLERLSREASISPLGSGENAVIITPEPSSHSVSPQENLIEALEAKAMVEISSESEEWLPTKPGRAPPTVEACYELQLDAMRLPPGVTSKVRLPDGSVTEVRGRGLQRPPSFEMDEFEKRYWTKKPIVTKEMWNNFVEVRACEGVPKIVDTLKFEALRLESNESQMKENAREGSLSHSSEASNGNSSDYKNVAKDATNGQNIVRGFTRQDYRSAAEPSAGSEPCVSILKQSSASSPSMWLRGEDRAGWVSNEHLRNGRMTGSEALSSKGVSSVSIQNIHAMGRLPHLLDGTSEGQRLSAKSMLSAASKAASPRLTPRPVLLSPEGFYESYLHESRGVPMEGNDGFLAQVPKKEEM
ncbi:uncharacterized protein A1O5_01626 [Cladophialophora psammophila CBS 110553]|uniref:Uncharacterized protein n=1 Tax=Cladophialophora psammophila CBS 110553 TaxID=1182543 RepID=W9XC90_9EURO|nr:uncharacterized protein A1O5_01626 [Cladophialophora psammophila CBS 110553]EXJ74930.1 hypothetical protein A1O5_01626 [Cladophialophora psammophila CBS 110553]